MNSTPASEEENAPLYNDETPSVNLAKTVKWSVSIGVLLFILLLIGVGQSYVVKYSPVLSSGMSFLSY